MKMNYFMQPSRKDTIEMLKAVVEIGRAFGLVPNLSGRNLALVDLRSH